MLIRAAVRADLPQILALLADDEIARTRHGFTAHTTRAHERAFEEITAGPGTDLVVGESIGEIIATLQLTVVPGLSRNGMRRALIDAVRIRADRRGQRIGGMLLNWAFERARARGCGVVELMTDKRRLDAQRFYTRLGFVDSHQGMKRDLWS